MGWGAEEHFWENKMTFLNDKWALRRIDGRYDNFVIMSV